MAERVDVLAPAQQQRLGYAARLRLAPYQARGHHAGLIGHEQITWLEVVDDIAEDAVLHGATVGERGPGLAVAPVQHEQTAAVAGVGGGLGDQLVGQLVVKVIGAHWGLLMVDFQPTMIAQGRGAYEWWAALRSSRSRARSSAASAAENRHPQ